MNMRFEDDEQIRFKKKFNKNKYCKKNKLSGGKYGPHLYKDDQKYCSRCGHINKIANDPTLDNKGE